MNLQQNIITGHVLKILSDFLKNRNQIVVFNGHYSKWADVNAGVPQGSILEPLLLLVYINDLADGLSLNAQLFADNDTSLFSITHNIITSATVMNNDWTYQWEMTFNQDPNKQAQEIFCSLKNFKKFHSCLFFNRNSVSQTSSLKHFGIILDACLSFKEHLDKI